MAHCVEQHLLVVFAQCVSGISVCFRDDFRVFPMGESRSWGRKVMDDAPCMMLELPLQHSTFPYPQLGRPYVDSAALAKLRAKTLRVGRERKFSVLITNG